MTYFENLEEMFYNPKAYNIVPYNNIWEAANSSVSYFKPHEFMNDKPVASKEQIDALDEMNSIRVEITQLMTRVNKMNFTHRSREKSIIFSNLEVAHLYANQDIETNHKL